MDWLEVVRLAGVIVAIAIGIGSAGVFVGLLVQTQRNHSREISRLQQSVEALELWRVRADASFAGFEAANNITVVITAGP